MGIGDLVSVIWKGYKAGSRGKDLAKMGVNVAGLEVADAKIQENQRSYINDKSESNSKAVKANIITIRDYIQTQIAPPPGLLDIKDLESYGKYEVKSVMSAYASQLLFEINVAIISGNLPPIDDVPWSSRRASYVRLRDGAKTMAMQFEGIVRNKQKDLKNITDYEARLFALSFAPELTDADLRMIQQDLHEQKADEDSTRRALTIFTVLAGSSRKNFEHFNEIIEAGDRANSKK